MLPLRRNGRRVFRHPLREPIRGVNYYSAGEIYNRVKAGCRLFTEEGAVVPFTALNSSRDEIIGVCTFSNIIWPFRGCPSGYSIAEELSDHIQTSKINPDDITEKIAVKPEKKLLLPYIH